MNIQNLSNLLGKKIFFRYVICGQIFRKTGVVTELILNIDGYHKLSIDGGIQSYEIEKLINFRILDG